jgi:hypothetical protein
MAAITGLLKNVRQRNSQRHIALMVESFRPRTPGGCVAHTELASREVLGSDNIRYRMFNPCYISDNARIELP